VLRVVPVLRTRGVPELRVGSHDLLRVASCESLYRLLFVDCCKYPVLLFQIYNKGLKLYDLYLNE